LEACIFKDDVTVTSILHSKDLIEGFDCGFLNGIALRIAVFYDNLHAVEAMDQMDQIVTQGHGYEAFEISIRKCANGLNAAKAEGGDAAKAECGGAAKAEDETTTRSKINAILRMNRCRANSYGY
jgi:hypothetical protein